MPTFTCRTCRRSVTYLDRRDVPYHPFCSERCQMVDLGAWFDGRYRIEGSSDDDVATELPDADSTE